MPAVITFAALFSMPEQNDQIILIIQYILSTLLNEIDMIWDIEYSKWEARAEMITAYFVNVLNRNIQLMTENLAVDDKPYVVFVYRHITTMRTPGYKLRSQKETLFYKRFHDAAANR